MHNAYHSKDSEADNSQTPWWVVHQIGDVANVNIIHDVCAKENSRKAATYWDKKADAFSKDWASKLFRLNGQHENNNALWMNPPFSLAKEFTEKAATEAIYGCVIIGCVKHAPDADWFIEMEKRATFIYVPDGRIQFLTASGEPFERPEMKNGIPTGKNVKSGANFPLCFPLWTPFNNGGEAKYVRFKRDMEKYK